MSKKSLTNVPEIKDNPWDEPAPEAVQTPAPAETQVETSKPLFAEITAPAEPEEVINPEDNTYDLDLGYDLEGLKTDFPTATELTKFVFDETGFSLNLKGRSNDVKYQVALDVLNGKTPPAAFLIKDNPYLDKADLIPEEPLKPVPERDPRIALAGKLQNAFYSGYVPHPDATMRAMNRKVDVVFRKYVDGTITYEVLGPLLQMPEGNKIDRFGRRRPEILRWVDPRTGEQIAQLPDGTQTARGRKIRAVMRTLPFNKTNHWDKWIDRDFVITNQSAIANPWD